MMISFETYELRGEELDLIYFPGHGDSNVCRTAKVSDFISWAEKKEYLMDTGFADAIKFDGHVMTVERFMECDCPTEYIEEYCGEIAPCHPYTFSGKYELALEMLLIRLNLKIDIMAMEAEFGRILSPQNA